MPKVKLPYVILYFILIPVIIFLYFLNWKTDVIYGDDLYVYKDYFDAGRRLAKVNMSTIYEKYRPVHDMVVALLIRLCNKNIFSYYVFNVLVQAINAVIFARIAQLFIKSVYFCALLGLMIGISRFSYYNITQLFNGGALEGMAMTFFLLSLFFVLKAITDKKLTEANVKNNALYSILFANLSLYTHERYIVILPFLILVFTLTKRFKILPLRKRIDLSFLVFVSLLLNVLIKKVVFSMPFFVGTGGSKIEFSLERATGYIHDGLLSIIQINSGPDYLSGMHFNGLPALNKGLVITVVAFTFVVILSWLGITIFKAINKPKPINKQSTDQFHTSAGMMLFLLGALFFLFLIPAVITIRLEQRWLQASYSVFILMLIIAISDLNLSKNKWLSYSILLITTISVINDYMYLNKGIQYLYLTGAQNAASLFEKGLKNDEIHTRTRNIYIVEKARNTNDENGLLWALGNGYIFDFYKYNTMGILFVDSVYERMKSVNDTNLKRFNPSADEIVLLKDHIIDLTSDYEKDSLKNLKFD